jgi:hypothetical protein
MSVESLQEIIGRAVMEPEFRELLFNDPHKAMEGYELTEEEVASLKQVHPEKFDAVAGELEERISRAGGLGPLLRSGSPIVKIEAVMWPYV